MKYDFIVFENAYDIENHYKDLFLFASLLKKMGYRVAIADVFKEPKLCKDNDIPHISLKFQCPKRFSTLTKFRVKTSCIQFQMNRVLQSLYLIYAIVALRNNAKNFYIGSLTSYTPSLWLYFLIRKNNYFIWGLRSHLLYSWKNQINSFTLTSMLRSYVIKKRPNIKIVTSNEIIKNEFISLGINSNRMIVRPERWITELRKITNRNVLPEFNLLTIGTLRKSKHVEYVLDALKLINDDSYKYTIAGRCKENNGYEEMIKERSVGVHNVKRINSYIDEDEYVDLFNQSDFIVLCDEKELSCATNGTMFEALIMGKPIIAPNHEPFRYEVERYGIGLLYDLNDSQSLVKTLRKAKELGANSFCENILKYQETLLEKNVIFSVEKQIKTIL